MLRSLCSNDVLSSYVELKDQTLHIRISGVDAPENAHFGNPSQPHAKESLDWLKSTITGKRMIVQLLRKDQYNRIVSCNLYPSTAMD
jgi:endonuclease YncB( thermonuclease family)